jgi:hypothetical protein
MGKFRSLIIFAVSIAVMLVVCLTVTIVFSSLAKRHQSKIFNDSDLIPVRFDVPVESNAFWTLLKATNELYWPEKLEHKLADLSDDTNWNDSLAADVLEKNRGCLDLFDEAMRQPFLLVPQPKTFDEECLYLGGWKAISRVEAIQAVALFREQNEKDAFGSVVKIIQFGQRVENSGGPIIHYLVGAAIKSIGLQRIQQMIPQTTFQETNLVGLIDVLNGFKANREGLTNALKVEYEMERDWVDNFAAGKISTMNSNSDQTVVSLGLKVVFSAAKTKMKFAQTARVLLDSVSKPYGGIPWSDLPVVSTNASPWQRLFSGNAVGDIFFELLEPSLQSFASRKCRENVEVTATQLLLALKAYKMQHGKLPASLSELVPEFFAQVPIDDFDGKPFRYTPDKKLIYSVGPDLKDSGGVARQKNSDTYDLPFKIEF